MRHQLRLGTLELTVAFDIAFWVFVHQGYAIGMLGLEGDEGYRDVVAGLQVDVLPEVTKTLVFFLAHVLVVGLAGGIDPLPPRGGAGLGSAGPGHSITDVVVVPDRILGLGGLVALAQPLPQFQQLG